MGLESFVDGKAGAPGRKNNILNYPEFYILSAMGIFVLCLYAFMPLQ
jgi:hypothetical protein